MYVLFVLSCVISAPVCRHTPRETFPHPRCFSVRLFPISNFSFCVCLFAFAEVHVAPKRPKQKPYATTLKTLLLKMLKGVSCSIAFVFQLHKTRFSKVFAAFFSPVQNPPTGSSRNVLVFVLVFNFPNSKHRVLVLCCPPPTNYV